MNKLWRKIINKVYKSKGESSEFWISPDARFRLDLWENGHISADMEAPIGPFITPLAEWWKKNNFENYVAMTFDTDFGPMRVLVSRPDKDSILEVNEKLRQNKFYTKQKIVDAQKQLWL